MKANHVIVAMVVLIAGCPALAQAQLQWMLSERQAAPRLWEPRR
jgi:Tfp pilus assembly protein PilV